MLNMEPTRVWVTTSGASVPTVYHESPRCQSIRGSSGSTRGRALRGLDGSRRCTQCWPTLDGFDLVAHDTERDGDSDFEVVFVRRVLERVRGLAPQDVVPQKKLKLNDGTSVRVDFYLERAGRGALVVELDGYEKTPDAPPREVHRRDKAKRRRIEQDLKLEVVDFANIDLSDPHLVVRDMEARLSLEVTVRQPVLAQEQDAGTEGHGSRRRLLIVGAALVCLVAAVLAVWLFWGRERALVTPLKGGTCPAEAPIKGNVNEAGEKIFHEPGWRYYEVYPGRGVLLHG